MQLRPATADDADSIAAVHVASWHETYRGVLPDAVLQRLSVAERAQRWRTWFEALAPLPLLVAEAPDKSCVGFAAGGPRRSDLLPADGEIYAIYILRAAQRQGVGSALVSWLAEMLRDKGATSLGSWVLRNNFPARRFYQQMGGHLAAERLEHRPTYDSDEVAYAWPDITVLVAPSPA
jgi:ribosomal protein S18 acetylase RimI-like enzyme